MSMSAISKRILRANILVIQCILTNTNILVAGHQFLANTTPRTSENGTSSPSENHFRTTQRSPSPRRLDFSTNSTGTQQQGSLNNSFYDMGASIVSLFNDGISSRLRCCCSCPTSHSPEHTDIDADLRSRQYSNPGLDPNNIAALFGEMPMEISSSTPENRRNQYSMSSPNHIIISTPTAPDRQTFNDFNTPDNGSSSSMFTLRGGPTNNGINGSPLNSYDSPPPINTLSHQDISDLGDVRRILQNQGHDSKLAERVFKWESERYNDLYNNKWLGEEKFECKNGLNEFKESTIDYTNYFSDKTIKITQMDEFDSKMPIQKDIKFSGLGGILKKHSNVYTDECSSLSLKELITLYIVSSQPELCTAYTQDPNEKLSAIMKLISEYEWLKNDIEEQKMLFQLLIADKRMKDAKNYYQNIDDNGIRTRILGTQESDKFNINNFMNTKIYVKPWKKATITIRDSSDGNEVTSVTTSYLPQVYTSNTSSSSTNLRLGSEQTYNYCDIRFVKNLVSKRNVAKKYIPVLKEGETKRDDAARKLKDAITELMKFEAGISHGAAIPGTSSSSTNLDVQLNNPEAIRYKILKAWQDFLLLQTSVYVFKGRQVDSLKNTKASISVKDDDTYPPEEFRSRYNSEILSKLADKILADKILSAGNMKSTKNIYVNDKSSSDITDFNIRNFLAEKTIIHAFTKNSRQLKSITDEQYKKEEFLAELEKKYPNAKDGTAHKKELDDYQTKSEEKIKYDFINNVLLDKLKEITMEENSAVKVEDQPEFSELMDLTVRPANEYNFKDADDNVCPICLESFNENSFPHLLYPPKIVEKDGVYSYANTSSQDDTPVCRSQDHCCHKECLHTYLANVLRENTPGNLNEDIDISKINCPVCRTDVQSSLHERLKNATDHNEKILYKLCLYLTNITEKHIDAVMEELNLL